jgi:hypothetical protein
MRRMASEVPTTLIEIAKLRSTDESPWDVDVALVLVLVCDVEEIIDEVIEGSRTSKMLFSVWRSHLDTVTLEEVT